MPMIQEKAEVSQEMAASNAAHKLAKRIKRVLFIILFVLIAVTVSISAARLYNGHKYADLVTKAAPAYYADPVNLALYPRDISGVTVTEINHGAAQGFHLRPTASKNPGVVVVYGGSEGTPGYENAVKYAENGYEVLSLFMFGRPNQPSTLTKIPLEQFDDVLSYLREIGADTGSLTVVGASKGAEYALNLAVKYPQIAHLILISPSAYIFNGLDFKNYGSSWTWRGAELPYVDVKQGSFSDYIGDVLFPMLTKAPVTYKNVYASAVANDPEIARKAIAVADTSADILILAGEDDCMWGSSAMAKEIHNARPEGTTVQIYPDAGHILSGGPYIQAGNMLICVGGTKAGNSEAADKSAALILNTLHKWHQVKERIS
ncbi:MAG: hypothetical protein MR006_03830 [Arcanobacterium sp.]|nr:hypothetical protein [Arcanobacterium sp.]MDY5588584.1 acyl-CoA thioester hydrolase/BAAT C-terminal domain-containing protein [Arcanobacterium sp.]